MDFIYNGQVKVYHSDLDEFLKIAGRLGIKGIRQNNSRTEENNLILIKIKKETFEKENNEATEVVEEEEDEEKSYQVGDVEGGKKLVSKKTL